MSILLLEKIQSAMQHSCENIIFNDSLENV